jgi:hypothetical protein
VYKYNITTVGDAKDIRPAKGMPLPAPSPEYAEKPVLAVQGLRWSKGTLETLFMSPIINITRPVQPDAAVGIPLKAPPASTGTSYLRFRLFVGFYGGEFLGPELAGRLTPMSRVRDWVGDLLRAVLRAACWTCQIIFSDPLMRAWDIPVSARESQIQRGRVFEGECAGLVRATNSAAKQQFTTVRHNQLGQILIAVDQRFRSQSERDP